MENERSLFAEASDGEIKKLVDKFRTKKHEKTTLQATHRMYLSVVNT